jgi:nascent polypeptide-associated complex subunit alpha
MATEEPRVEEEGLKPEEDDAPEKKLNRAEKKCRKALIKMGLKTVAGITRISIKRRDGLVFLIQDPEVFKSPTADGTKDSYVFLGEMKTADEPRIDESAAKAAADAHSHAGHSHPHPQPTNEEGKISEVPSATEPATETKVAEAEEVDDSEPLNEEGLTPMHIDMVMQNAGCTRN